MKSPDILEIEKPKYQSDYPDDEVNFDNTESEMNSPSSSRQITDIENQNGMKRSLKSRHIQMLALGNAIGTGIFLNSGRNIAEGGPGGALIAYCVVGVMIYCIMTCIGEMSTYLPVSGSFFQFASRFVDKSLGFALGVNFWWISVSLAVELTSAANVIKFWRPVMPDAVWTSIFWIALISMNLLDVRVFGEIEYWLTMVKILVIIVFLIVATLVTTGAVGGQQIGLMYWKNPGAFTKGGLGTINVLLQAGYTYLGTESVTSAAGEAENPTKTIPQAIRAVFWRILIFVIATIFLIGLCIPYTDPRLSFSSSSPGTSAFTLIFEKAGIRVGAHIINAVILISVLSAANAIIYYGSRTIVGMAHDGNAPKILIRVNRFGSPYCAIFAATFLGFFCTFISIYGTDTVLVWCLNLTSVSSFINWVFIPVVQLRFRKGYIHQGKNIKNLPYKASFYPFSAIFGIVLPVIIIFGQGYVSFYPEWNSVKFISCYIGLLPFSLSYIIHKIVTKNKVVPLDKIDFETGRVAQVDPKLDEKKLMSFLKFRFY